MRGTELALAGAVVAIGITPACAGNSFSPDDTQVGIEDHPRVCGEQFAATLPIRRCIGSPPRVRGTAFPTSHGSPLMGITPACAGNSTFIKVLSAEA